MQEDTESQEVVLNIQYPMRIFRVTAVYRLQDTLLDGTALVLWNVRAENKTAELRARWDSPPQPAGAQHLVLLALTHPSFRKVWIIRNMSETSLLLRTIVFTYTEKLN